MTSLTATSPRIDALNPVFAATAGAATFAIALTAGEVFGLNSDESGAPATTWGDVALYAGLLGVAFLIAVWLGVRARSGTPKLLVRTAIGLAVASAALFVVFWSGWPHVFAAVAIALALEHRRRVGSFSATAAAALVVGAVVFVASTVTCVIG